MPLELSVSLRDEGVAVLEEADPSYATAGAARSAGAELTASCDSTVTLRRRCPRAVGAARVRESALLRGPLTRAHGCLRAAAS